MHRSAYGVEVCYQALAGPGVPAGGHAPVGPWSGGQLSSTGRPWGAGWWTCTGQPMEWRSVIKHWQALGCWLVDMHRSVHGWRSVIKYWPALGCRPVDMHRSAHGVVCYQALAGLGGEGWWTCTGRPMEWSVIKHWPALGCRLVHMHRSAHGVEVSYQALAGPGVPAGGHALVGPWMEVCYQALAGPGVAAGGHSPVRPWMEVCYQALAGSGGAGWWTCTGRPMEWSVIKHWQALGWRLVDMHRSVHGVVCYQALAGPGVAAGGHAPVRPWMEVSYQALASSGVPAGGHALVSPQR
ncbi:hypothetical protein NDU88_007365 [Pleurodeles waltl]|uniref:Uncharacterized protein n=1 Tax=Pleurodeles waltl TaxID=8319 RepID=A0AAV7MMR8_PLEWA|nr:hypothetical protein NDU88_007365 [Pleurodeles waltl]